MEREIYRGGGHYVTCDGRLHRTTKLVQGVCGRLHGQTETYVSSTCFCSDPEYLEKGFSYELLDRYRVTQLGRTVS